jgi:hypothetical protein
MLIWDHNRLWGSFQFDFFKGVLLIDPGPVEVLEQPKSYPFTWRGTSLMMPDTHLNSPLNTGEIRMGGNRGDIRGHFDTTAAGLLAGDRYEFNGYPLLSPCRVPRSLQSFIDEWDKYAFSEENETVRLLPGSKNNLKSPELLTSSLG